MKYRQALEKNNVVICEKDNLNLTFAVCSSGAHITTENAIKNAALIATCLNQQQDDVLKNRYVWLSIQDGTFSNSWDEETHKKHIDEGIMKIASENNMKLIKYQCLTDENFEFYNQMKLR